MTEQVWSKTEFEKKLREMGKRYHIHHPLHVMMNTGGMSQEQVKGWVANRFYYQIKIPQKDGAILSNCTDRDVRRLWIQRIIDHDGRQGEEGGIEAWIRLGEAVGIERETLLSEELVLPGVRFAVDAYVNFAKTAPWQDACISSLTELFAPKIHKVRLENWPVHYPWIEKKGFEYFQNRLSEAPRDVEHGLQIALENYTTRKEQDKAIKILQFKLDVLWSMLDSMYVAYVDRLPVTKTIEVDVWN